MPVCTSINSVTWTVYQGTLNSSSSNIFQWTPFPSMAQFENRWFFGQVLSLTSKLISYLLHVILGSNSSNFTTTPDLFLVNPSIGYWRFEVLYSLPSTTGSSALNFIINQSPQNGSCSVSPPNGTTSTWFTIACSQWQDTDGIKDFSFYSLFLSFPTDESVSTNCCLIVFVGWTGDSKDRTIIAFSPLPTLQIRLPAGDINTSLLHLSVAIRDKMDCVTRVNLSSVLVTTDSNEIREFLRSQQASTTDPIVHDALQWQPERCGTSA